MIWNITPCMEEQVQQTKARTSPKAKSLLTRVLVGLLATYIGVYCVLSANGSYRPAVVNLRGIAGYSWAPLGFYRTTSAGVPVLKKSMAWSFFPLYAADLLFVHRVSFDGKSPADSLFETLRYRFSW
jgi:hypothetical protein